MLPAVRIDRVSLGTKIADLGHRQVHCPLAIRGLHGNVVPRGVTQRNFTSMGLDDFAPDRGCMAQIRTQQHLPTLRERCAISLAQADAQSIADKAQDAFAGRWRHDQLLH
jgi:hypothetical protein